MDNAEAITFVFDRDGIAETGVDLLRVAAVVDAFKELCDHVIKFAAAQSGPPATGVGTLPTIMELRLRAEPFSGSLKLPLWAGVSIGALSVLANASQVSGVTLRDSLSIIRSFQQDDPVSSDVPRELLSSNGTHILVERLLKSASSTGCSYVAIEWGNQHVILHGGKEARFSFISSQPPQKMTNRFTGSSITGLPSNITKVYFRGRAYPAFAIDGSGAPYHGSGGMMPSSPSAVIVWASKRELAEGVTYSVKTEILQPTEVTHGPDIPNEFRSAAVILYVSGASPVSYE